MITGKVADILYAGGMSSEHHGEAVARGYSIEVPDDMSAVGAASDKEEAFPSIIPLLADADVAAGEAYFKKKCALCHDASNGGANKTGPNLWNVVGHDKGSHAGFNYSSAMSAAPGNWDFDELSHFIFKPKAHVPGTIMAFAGEKKEENRADLIAWLRTMNDNPPAIPAAPAAEEAPAAE
jgi:cytochrome c